LLHPGGAKVDAVSDSRGGIHSYRGLDPKVVQAHKSQTGTVVGVPGTDRIGNRELLELRVDILLPAALENQITEENAPKIKPKILAEAANGPTTPDADPILHENGVFLIPDILANAGGVTVSYFEWVQDLANYFWTEDEVNQKLETVMRRSFRDVASLAEKHHVHNRTAAYMLGVGRVAETTRLRGLYGRFHSACRRGAPFQRAREGGHGRRTRQERERRSSEDSIDRSSAVLGRQRPPGRVFRLARLRARGDRVRRARDQDARPRLPRASAGQGPLRAVHPARAG